MAKSYKLYYTFDYTTQLTNELTNVEIYKYTLDENNITVKDLTDQNNGLTFTFDSNDDPYFGPIKSTICSVELVNLINFEFFDILNAEPYDFVIHVYKTPVNGTKYLYYKGYNINFSYKESYRQPPYYTKIEFTDGISYLKNYKYLIEEGTKYFDFAKDYIYNFSYNKDTSFTLKDVLIKIFEKLSIGDPNLFETKISTAIYVAPYTGSDWSNNNWQEFLDLRFNSQPLHLSKDISYYDVLKLILSSFNLQIRYDINNTWWIYNQAYSHLMQHNDFGYYTYDKEFNTPSIHRTVINTEFIDKPENADFSYVDNSRSFTVEQKYDAVELSVKPEYNINLFYAGNFAEHIIEIMDNEYWKPYNDIEINWSYGDSYVLSLGETEHISDNYMLLLSQDYSPGWDYGWYLGYNPHFIDSLPEFKVDSNLRYGVIKSKAFQIPETLLNEYLAYNDVLYTNSFKLTIDLSTFAGSAYPPHENINDDTCRYLPYTIICRDNSNTYTLIPRDEDGDRFFKVVDKLSAGYRVMVLHNYACDGANLTPSENTGDFDFLKIGERNKYEIKLKFSNEITFDGNVEVMFYMFNPYHVNVKIYDIKFELDPNKSNFELLYKYQNTNKFNANTKKIDYKFGANYLLDQDYMFSENFKLVNKKYTMAYMTYLNNDYDWISTWNIPYVSNIEYIEYLAKDFSNVYTNFIGTITSNLLGSIHPVTEFIDVHSNNMKLIISKYTYNDKLGISNVELITKDKIFNDYSFNVQNDTYSFGTVGTDTYYKDITFIAHPNSTGVLTYHYTIVGDSQFTLETTEEQLGAGYTGTIRIKFIPDANNTDYSATITVVNEYYQDSFTIVGNTNFGNVTMDDRTSINISFSLDGDLYYSVTENNWTVSPSSSQGNVYIFKHGSAGDSIVSADDVQVKIYTSKISQNTWTLDSDDSNYETSTGLKHFDLTTFKYKIEALPPDDFTFVVSPTSVDFGLMDHETTGTNMQLYFNAHPNHIGTADYTAVINGAPIFSLDNNIDGTYNQNDRVDVYVHCDPIVANHTDNATLTISNTEYSQDIPLHVNTNYKNFYGLNGHALSIYLKDKFNTYHLIPTTEGIIYQSTFYEAPVSFYKSNTGTAIVPADYVGIKLYRRTNSTDSWVYINQDANYESLSEYSMSPYQYEYKFEIYDGNPATEENGDIYGYNKSFSDINDIFIVKDDDSFIKIPIDTDHVFIIDNRQKSNVKLTKVSGTYITHDDRVKVDIYNRPEATSDSFTLVDSVDYYESQNTLPEFTDIATKDYSIVVSYIPLPVYDIYGENKHNSVSVYVFDGSYNVVPPTEQIMMNVTYTSKDLYLYKSNTGTELVVSDYVAAKLFSRPDSSAAWSLDGSFDVITSQDVISLMDLTSYEYKIELDNSEPTLYENGDVYGYNDDSTDIGDVYIVEDDGTYTKIPTGSNHVFIANNRQKSNLYLVKYNGDLIGTNDNIKTDLYSRAEGTSDTFNHISTIEHYDSNTAIVLSDLENKDYSVQVSYTPPPTYKDVYGENTYSSVTIFLYDGVYKQLPPTLQVMYSAPYVSKDINLYKSNTGEAIIPDDHIKATLYYKANPGDNWTVQNVWNPVSSLDDISLLNCEDYEYLIKTEEIPPP